MNVIEQAKARPVTSALVVLGVAAVGWYALAQPQAEDPEQYADPFAVGGFTYTGPDSASVQAATALQIAQIEDQRATRDLQVNAALAQQTLQSQHTLELARITSTDAANARQYQTAQYLTSAQLEEIKIAAAHDENTLRETNRSNEVLANLQTRINLEQIGSNERLGIAQNNANINATRAQAGTQRSGQILSTVGTIAGVVASFFL